MSHSTDEQDFQRFRSHGDPRALGRVFDRLAPELLLVAAHLAGGDVAEDLVQSTFLDAIRQKDRWTADRPLAPWLVGILANHVREHRRQQHRVPDPQRLHDARAEAPDALAEARELAEAVHGAVARLPLAYRQVLSLRLQHGLELQQIANGLGVPLGTVKTRLYRGMVLLRRALPAGLASALAAALTPMRGLAEVREVVLGRTGAATGTTTGTAAGSAQGAAGIVAGPGTLIGVLAMKKVSGVLCVVAVVASVWVAVEWPTSGSVGSSADRGGPIRRDTRSETEHPVSTDQPVELDPAVRRKAAGSADTRITTKDAQTNERGPEQDAVVSIRGLGPLSGKDKARFRVELTAMVDAFEKSLIGLAEEAEPGTAETLRLEAETTKSLAMHRAALNAVEDDAYWVIPVGVELPPQVAQDTMYLHVGSPVIHRDQSCNVVFPIVFEDEPEMLAAEKYLASVSGTAVERSFVAFHERPLAEQRRSYEEFLQARTEVAQLRQKESLTREEHEILTRLEHVIDKWSLRLARGLVDPDTHYPQGKK